MSLDHHERDNVCVYGKFQSKFSKISKFNDDNTADSHESTLINDKKTTKDRSNDSHSISSENIQPLIKFSEWKVNHKLNTIETSQKQNKKSILMDSVAMTHESKCQLEAKSGRNLITNNDNSSIIEAKNISVSSSKSQTDNRCMENKAIEPLTDVKNVNNDKENLRHDLHLDAKETSYQYVSRTSPELTSSSLSREKIKSLVDRAEKSAFEFSKRVNSQMHDNYQTREASKPNSMKDVVNASNVSEISDYDLPPSSSTYQNAIDNLTSKSNNLKLKNRDKALKQRLESLLEVEGKM